MIWKNKIPIASKKPTTSSRKIGDDESMDDGASSVLAFLLIIIAIGIIFGVWAAVVLPDIIHSKEEQEVQSSISQLIDTKLMMDFVAKPTLHKSGGNAINATDVFISVGLPAGTIDLQDAGTLKLCVVGNDRVGSDDVDTNGFDTNEIETSMRHLTLSNYYGNSQTMLGILAGGVWRKDGAKAVWVVPPDASLIETGVYSPSKVKLVLNITNINQDAFAQISSTDFIPMQFSFSEERCWTLTGGKVTVTFVGEEWICSLMRMFFEETRQKYKSVLNADVSYDEKESVSSTFSLNSGNITVQINERLYTVDAEYHLGEHNAGGLHA